MTELEQQTLVRIKGACQQYIESRNTIDWEQRRYEIAKSVICGWAASLPPSNLESNVGYAIEIADELIRQLRG